MADTLTVRQASALIAEHLADGRIDRDTAVRAQAAIRERLYYGSPMTANDRQRLLALRFGIVDTASPVQALLRRAGGVA
ncbi:hypothetical protein [Xanthomonas arboricola]|uniref:Uncharacterized protein n=1 Tax=Xanthomonas arboricola TaxID=56448 RepID=A0AAU9I516_9XANT|nr:hypothetical protein [Xanthomonas arboricola]CAE6837651.1 hypothetical protein XA1314C_37420 [Xanthomonas arboricola]CAE6837675.1 hypothetical protein XA1314C_37420 [Xanthomonas arboricola]